MCHDLFLCFVLACALALRCWLALAGGRLSLWGAAAARRLFFWLYRWNGSLGLSRWRFDRWHFDRSFGSHFGKRRDYERKLCRSAFQFLRVPGFFLYGNFFCLWCLTSH